MTSQTNELPHYGIVSYVDVCGRDSVCRVMKRSKIPVALFLLMEKHNGTAFSNVQEEYVDQVLMPQALKKDDPTAKQSNKFPFACIEEFTDILEAATVPHMTGFVVDFLFSYPDHDL